MTAHDARALFAAARDDGPDNVEREAVFRGVALATGIVTATAVVAGALSAAAPAPVVTSTAVEVVTQLGVASSGATKAGGAMGLKLLAAGAALGVASTALGVLLAVAVVMPELPGAAPTPGRIASSASPPTVSVGAKLARPEPRKRASAAASASATMRTSAAASASVTMRTSAIPSAAPAAGAAAKGSGGSELAEEARLVTSARDALVAGDPARALMLVQDARKRSVRSLEPEELGLEARALRALGRADEAAATELLLRRRYPEHALAR